MSLLGLLTPLKPILSIIFMYSLSEGVKVEGASTQHRPIFRILNVVQPYVHFLCIYGFQLVHKLLLSLFGI